MAGIFMTLKKTLFICFVIFQSSMALCPSACKCGHRKVDCSKHDLDFVPHFDATMDRVTYVDLDTNSISSLTADDFKNLNNVQTLILQFNQIKTILTDTFRNLTNLKNLNLKGNNIASLPLGLFDGLKNFDSLDLSQNYLSSLDGVLSGLGKLFRLDISHNNLPILTDITFKDLQGLMYLLIANNQVRDISPNAFSPLTKLSYLVLKNNPLFNVDHKFLNNRRMSYIDMTSSKLSDIPQGLPRVLRYLQLSNNNITSIRKQDLKLYNYVGVIVLDQNKISSVETGAFLHMKYLRELWLNGNKLTSIPKDLPLQLRYLYLDANEIQELHTHIFTNQSNLQTLSLKGNRLQAVLRESFNKLPNVTKLYLDNNNITQIKGFTFDSLRKLRRLFISRNPLKRLNKNSFFGLQHLRYLQMAFITTKVELEDSIFSKTPELVKLELQYSNSLANTISGSPAILGNLKNLTELNIMSTELSSLNPALKDELTRLETLRLADNKWHCDKSLVWLKHWMRIETTLFANKMDIKCFSPRSLNGMVMSSMYDYQFVPMTSTTAETSVFSTTPFISTTTTSTSVTTATTTWTKPITRKKTTSSTTTPRQITKKQTTKTTWVPDTSTKMSRRSTSRLRTTTSPFIVRTWRFTAPTSLRPSPSKKQTVMSRTSAPTTDKDFHGAKTRYQTKITFQAYTSSRKTTSKTNDVSTVMPPVWNSSVSSHELEPGKIQSDSGDNVNYTAIAIGVSVAILLVIISIVGYLVFRYRRNQENYHRAVQYQPHRDMYYITLSEPDIKQSKTRSERGSTSSHTSEDITNEDGGVKFFHWDNSS